jgi:putative two-component system response regulator
MKNLHPDVLQLSRQRDHLSASECKAALLRLSGEVTKRLQQGTPESIDFFSAVIKVISGLQGSSHAELRMRCLFEAGLYFYSNGRDEKTVAAAASLIKLAEHVGDRKWIRKGQTLSGVGHAHIGNVAEAVLHFAIALPISREVGDIEGEISTLSNLGSALIYGGLYREAIPCFIQGAVRSADWHDRDIEAACFCNLAQGYFHLEEYDRSMEAINRSLALSAQPGSAFQALKRAVRELTFVQVSLELNNWSQSKAHTALCEQFCLQCGTPRSRLVAKICRGLYEVYAGDVSTGLLALEEALVIADQVSTVERADVLSAMVKCYDHAGRPELALDRMTQLLAHVKGVRKRSVAAMLALTNEDNLLAVPTSDSHDLGALHTKEAQLRARVAEQSAISSRLEMFERLAVTADLKEDRSGEHGYRVGKLAGLIATELGWPADAAFAIEIAGRLHDIGKIGVPDRVLFASTELLPRERAFISVHAVIGAELLGKSDVPQVRMAEEVARFHHEWWNGQGYPAKASGKRIPIHARIVSVADVFDALTHGRPFAAPWTFEEAINAVRAGSGSQFDPEIVEAFLRVAQRLPRGQASIDSMLGQAASRSPLLKARRNIRDLLETVSQEDFGDTAQSQGHRAANV